MGRFLRFVLANLCVLSLVGWLQLKYSDPASYRGGFGSWSSGVWTRSHKRVRRGRPSDLTLIADKSQEEN